MAAISNHPATPKKGRGTPPSLRIDMTPMVDLGFLLITFFVFTASLNASYAMPLVVPADGPPSQTAASATLTVLLGADNRMVAYTGTWEDAVQHKRLHTVGYSITAGIGKQIRQLQQQITDAGKSAGDLVLLIKPTPQASYKNVVDMLDEVTINAVQRYALVAPTEAELSFMEQR